MKRRIIFTESQVRMIVGESLDELKAFHGSNSNFDKFNHKKYLSSGCGCQSFGWGTYVTDDFAIGMSYAEHKKYLEYEINGKTVETFRDFNEYIKDFLIKHGMIFKDFDLKYNVIEVSKIIDKLLKEKESAYNVIKFLREEFNHSSDVYDREEYKGIISCIYFLIESGLKTRTYNNMLYEVEIPDNNGSNYLDWYGDVPAEFIKSILYGLYGLRSSYLKFMCNNDSMFANHLYSYFMQDKHIFANIVKVILSEKDYSGFFSNSYGEVNGSIVYKKLSRWFNSAKAASLFLMNCGFDGIVYEAGTIWGKPEGSSDDSHNYVIFNASNIRITGKDDISDFL